MSEFDRGACWCKCDGIKNWPECVTDIEYIGDGKFQCPACKRIEDLSEYMFDVKVKITIKNCCNEDYVYFYILKPYDPKLKKLKGSFSENKEILEDDLCTVFPDHKLGVFDLLIFYNSYETPLGESGNFEEYLDLQIIEEKIWKNCEVLE